MDRLENLVANVQEFHREAFPLSNWKWGPYSQRLGILAHLKEEVKELEEAIVKEDEEEIRAELADVLILAFALAANQNWGPSQVHDLIAQKLAILKERKWLPPDEYGVVRHQK